jgi:hypothetical protein
MVIVCAIARGAGSYSVRFGGRGILMGGIARPHPSTRHPANRLPAKPDTRSAHHG